MVCPVQSVNHCTYAAGHKPDSGDYPKRQLPPAGVHSQFVGHFAQKLKGLLGKKICKVVLEFDTARAEQPKQCHHYQNQWEESEQEEEREFGGPSEDIVLVDAIEDVLTQLRKGQTSERP
jgi:hypothetical protein